VRHSASYPPCKLRRIPLLRTWEYKGKGEGCTVWSRLGRGIKVVYPKEGGYALRQASTLVRSLHKMGLAINLGGTLFGLVALNPTVKRVSDKSERGRVLNDAWTHFQAVGILAMGVTVAMWRLGGLKEAESDLDASLAGLKNILLGGALLTSVASAIAGRRIARQTPEGDTPVESGTEPAPETPEEAARFQRLSAFLGAATVALVAGVLGLSSALEVRGVEKSQGALSRLFS
jgi:hypothetical protein